MSELLALYEKCREALSLENDEEALQHLNALYEHSQSLDEEQTRYLNLTQLLTEVSQAKNSTTWAMDLRLWAISQLSQVYQRLSRDEEALPLLIELTRYFPKEPLVFHDVARCLLRLREGESALYYLTQVLRLDAYYLPVIEDLAYLANQLGMSDTVMELVKEVPLTERLFEEAFAAAARIGDDRFLETVITLAQQNIRPRTFGLLLQLCENLYQSQKMRLCQNLAGSLWQYDPTQIDAFNLFVLTALYNQDYAPAFQAVLFQLQQNPKQAELYFKKGMVLKAWNMPLFARQALHQALEWVSNTTLEPLIHKELNALPQEVTLEDSASEFLKYTLLDPVFRNDLQENPKDTLEKFGIGWSEELSTLLEKLGLVPR